MDQDYFDYINGKYYDEKKHLGMGSMAAHALLTFRYCLQSFQFIFLTALASKTESTLAQEESTDIPHLIMYLCFQMNNLRLSSKISVFAKGNSHHSKISGITLVCPISLIWVVGWIIYEAIWISWKSDRKPTSKNTQVISSETSISFSFMPTDVCVCVCTI